MPRAAQQFASASLEQLRRVNEQRNERTEQLLQNLRRILGSVNNIPEREEIPITGPLWEKLKADRSFETLTNFSEREVADLYRSMHKHVIASRKRGPPPSVTFPDALVCQLISYNTNEDFDSLGAMLGIKPSTLRDTIYRVKPLLNQALRERWDPVLFRPKPLEDNHFPHAALLVDSTTTETYRPMGKYQEQKQFFDGKNRIYGLKKEVAVLAQSPHYAMFVAPKEVGSVHDYTIFKRHYHRYLPWLIKTPQESLSLPNDRTHRSWAIMLDKGYVAEAEDTPDIRRITPIKNARSDADLAWNESVNKNRVHVECFFGRMQKLWKIFAEVYRFDHDSFDMDFENCMLLTNEHIRNKDLDEQDYLFYRFNMEAKARHYTEIMNKRKQSTEKYLNRKKQRLSTLLDAL